MLQRFLKVRARFSRSETRSYLAHSILATRYSPSCSWMKKALSTRSINTRRPFDVRTRLARKAHNMIDFPRDSRKVQKVVSELVGGLQRTLKTTTHFAHALATNLLRPSSLESSSLLDLRRAAARRTRPTPGGARARRATRSVVDTRHTYIVPRKKVSRR